MPSHQERRQPLPKDYRFGDARYEHHYREPEDSGIKSWPVMYTEVPFDITVSLDGGGNAGTVAELLKWRHPSANAAEQLKRKADSWNVGWNVIEGEPFEQDRDLGDEK